MNIQPNPLRDAAIKAMAERENVESQVGYLSFNPRSKFGVTSIISGALSLLGFAAMICCTLLQPSWYASSPVIGWIFCICSLSAAVVSSKFHEFSHEELVSEINFKRRHKE